MEGSPETVKREPSEPTRQPSGNLQDYEIKRLYDNAASAKTRKVSLEQIRKTLQLLSQCPTEATIQLIAADYTPVDWKEGDPIYVDLVQFTEILNTYTLTREERFAQLNQAFMYFDKAESGVVDTEPMRTMLLGVGDCLTEKECNEFFKEAQPGTDGKWPYDDFIKKLVDAYPRPKSKTGSGRKSARQTGKQSGKR